MNFDYLLKIEKEEGLLEQQIDGFYFWVYIRFDLSVDIQTKYYKQTQDVNRANHKKIKGVITQFFNAFNMLNVPLKQVDLLFINNGGRRYLEDGVYVDPIADDIMSEYDNSLMLEYSNGDHMRPAFTSKLRYIDIYTVEGYIYRYIIKFFLKSKEKEIYYTIFNSIKEPIEKIYKNYNVECCSIEKIAEKLTDFYYVRKVLLRKYSCILDRTNPKAIVEVWHGTLEKIVFTELAKERNIPVIELQHGATGICHLAYNYLAGESIKQFPDYFFVFSQFWKNCIKPPILSDNVMVVGCPYIERKANKYKKKKDRICGKNEKTILFLADKYNTEFLLNLANEVADFFKNDLRVIIKLHPLDNVEIQDYDEDSYVEIYSNNEMDLYYAFCISDYIVCTGGTTSLYEGLAFGLKSFIYLDKAYEEFCLLCEEGYAEGFNSTNELIELINSGESSRRPESFWESDSLFKMKRAIDCIVSKEP